MSNIFIVTSHMSLIILVHAVLSENVYGVCMEIQHSCESLLLLFLLFFIVKLKDCMF